MTAGKKKLAEAKKVSAPKKSAAKKSGAASSKTLTTKPKAKSDVAVLKFPRPSLVPSVPRESDRIDPRMQAVIDKSEIHDVLAKFARGLDRLDENLLRAVFHHDATLDYGPGVFQGTGSDYVHWIMGVLQNVRTSHHMIGNVRIELEGDVALVETYFHTHTRIDKPIGREDVFFGGRDLDRFERRPSGITGTWKIAHRKHVLDWVRTEPASDLFYHQNPDALWSARSKPDASYQMGQFPGTQSGGKLPAFLGRRYESKSMKF